MLDRKKNILFIAHNLTSSGGIESTIFFDNDVHLTILEPFDEFKKRFDKVAFKAADKVINHPDYSTLGGRLLLSRQSKLIGKELKDVDMTYDFFAATTFLKKYSMKDGSTPVELPSCMYERVSNHLASNAMLWQTT